ncbi:unnamed protein product [Trichobilharzia regenti]|nr:unnamed protein product [Trichobilharzia regenti]
MSETAVNILPTVDYPPMIRGSLRLILQLKDAFLGCFNLIEEYRSQLLTCQRSFARDIVVCQLTQGLEGIKRLREDLEDVKSQAQARIERNSALREYLTKNFSVVVLSEPSKNQGTGQSNEGIMSNSGGSSTNVTVVDRILPPPISAPDAVSAALHGGLDQFTFKDINVDCLQVPEEIDLATCTTEGGSPLLPVVEFYRGFYFLQMHFQVSNVLKQFN